MVDVYDAYLVAIAAVILAGGLTSLHPAVAVYQGVGAGSLLASLFLVHVLFRNPPAEPTRTAVSPSAIVIAGWLITVLTAL